MATYPGGKNGAGVVQKIINQIPPHEIYVEPFAGSAAVLRAKRPAAWSIALDLAAGPLQQLERLGLPGADLLQADGIQWLKYFFGLQAFGSAGVAESRDGRRRSAVVYADPPYLISSRRSGREMYDFELSDAQHVELLGVLVALPCHVIVSGYTSPLYEKALAGWRRMEFKSMTRRGIATEVLWMNFPAPAELHDYRFLGGNKRERERVRRKVRTWKAGLKRLPAHERAAILTELASV